ncbi:LysE family transporter [Niveibacterium sp. SC-1]|uniref:LysE family translocator n=1 Tax=Niveibacterium sp. SC-1 TaxID=3135646 RepID=UPI00311FBE65
MAFHVWFIYTLAALGLSLSPGPNSLLALTHGALHGRRMALHTVLGGSLGFLLIIALSMFGIGALLKASVAWLVALKWLGGAYLVWLGIQVWRSPPIQLATDAAVVAEVRGFSLFRQGFLAAATNPKGILFFAAFLPQFIDAQRSLAIQFLVIAATFVVLEFLTEFVLASLAQQIASWLARVGRAFNRACGAVFVGLGLLLPLRA